MSVMKNILVVAAHPDDEVLGCGGTIARHVAEGDTVHILIMAEGATSREGEVNGTKEVAILRECAKQAAAQLGACEPHFCGFADNRMDGLDALDIIKAIEAVVLETAPETIYTHYRGDLNVDHKIVHDAVLTACRPQPESIVKNIYAFETVSSSEWGGSTGREVFQPSLFVDITDHLTQKNNALACYDVEMRPFPHARSVENVEALARHRGASVGINVAEAFIVIREIR